VFLKYGLDLAYILKGNWLPAAGIISDRQHAKGNILGPQLADAGIERGHVHIAFKRALILGRQPFGAEQVQRPAAHIFDISPRGVEMAVILVGLYHPPIEQHIAANQVISVTRYAEDK
jgi:hypothetical protein